LEKRNNSRAELTTSLDAARFESGISSLKMDSATDYFLMLQAGLIIKVISHFVVWFM
jgi:hypothetical protein